MTLIKINWNPKERFLRRFGAFALLLLALLGVAAFHRQKLLSWHLSSDGARRAALALWALAALLGLLALGLPRTLKPVYQVLTLVTLPIGFVMSYAIMVVIYFGIFTPVGTSMRLTGWDAMHRRWDRNRTSYFSRRPPQSNSKRYFRQY
jgi:hypothetical protein